MSANYISFLRVYYNVIMLDCVNNFSNKWGLKINTKKPKSIFLKLGK